jgi:hypothetical protein
MENTKTCMTPLSELRDSALEHYEEITTKANSWYSQIPFAIKHYYNEKIRKETPFAKELESLINKHSQENGSNTPDFMLAEYLVNCLDNYNNIISKRDMWNSVDIAEDETTG